MITNFSYNQSEAAALDAPYSIRETGKYTVLLQQVSTRETPNGAQLVQFDFQDKATQANGSVTVFVTKKDGSPAFGASYLQALMGLTNTPKVNATKGKVFRRGGEAEEGFRLRELENKTVGIVIEKTFNPEYDVRPNRDGVPTAYPRLQLVTVFDPETGKTANETAMNLPARGMESRLARVMANVDSVNAAIEAWRIGNGAPAEAHQANHSTGTASAIDSLDEDVPF